MSRYYSFNPNQISDFSFYQFQNYLKNIPVLEGIFHGVKPQPEKNEDNDLLIAEAKALGLRVPTKIQGDE